MYISSSKLIDEVGELLKGGVADVFSTMLGLQVQNIATEDIRDNGEIFVAASVAFVGDVHGIVYLYFKSSIARTLAGRLLGLSEEDLTDDSIVGDAIGELSNMIVGAAQSRLCDSGIPCTLTVPIVTHGQDIKEEVSFPADNLLMCVACCDEVIQLELIMKSSQKPSVISETYEQNS